MNRLIRIGAPLVLALAAAACSGNGPSSMPAAGQSSVGAQAPAPDWRTNHLATRACNDTRPGYMNCDLLHIDSRMQPDLAGWGPADFEAVYKLPTSKGSGQIVAIVNAFDNPNVASDLATYRSQYGLGTANFKKFNQRGQQGNYPPANSDWGGEIALDVEMVSAVCPLCTIYLIEADDNYSNNLDIAEKEAVTLGAHIVSNSWGGGAGEKSGKTFTHKGVVYLASAGDSGYGMQDPADYNSVISVGGSVIGKSGSTYTQGVWNGSGAGCSVINKPSWQSDPLCSFRTGNDVSAVAWNVSFYDSGWGIVGGTSVSSPLIAGVFGLAGNASSRQSGKHFWTLTKKQLKKDLNAITTGGVAGCPTSLKGTYLCQAGTGQFGTYAAPTGWGTPKGIGAF